MKRIAIVINIIILFSLLCGVLRYYELYHNVLNAPIIKDTITITDTITVTAPPVKENKVTRKDTVYLPSPTLDDTIDVILPLEEKVYEDSTFRAVISGFKPSLKELTIYPTTTTITEKKLIRTKEKGFKLRPSIGIGYGLINKEPDLYLGISLTYNF